MVVAMRQRLSLILCVAVAAVVSAQTAAPFNDSIRLADLKADLFFLAGDGFKGRLVGTPENAVAIATLPLGTVISTSRRNG